MILSDKWVNFSQIQYFFNVSVLTLNKRVIVGRWQKYSCYVLHVFIVNNSKGCYHNNNPEKNYNIKKNDQANFSDRSNRENTQKTGTIFLHPLTGVPCATGWWWEITYAILKNSVYFVAHWSCAICFLCSQIYESRYIECKSRGACDIIVPFLGLFSWKFRSVLNCRFSDSLYRLRIFWVFNFSRPRIFCNLHHWRLVYYPSILYE